MKPKQRRSGVTSHHAAIKVKEAEILRRQAIAEIALEAEK